MTPRPDHRDADERRKRKTTAIAVLALRGHTVNQLGGHATTLPGELRSKLKVRSAPYLHRLTAGRHIGFRRISTTTDGTWLCLSYDPEESNQRRRSLGAWATEGFRNNDPKLDLSESRRIDFLEWTRNARRELRQLCGVPR